MTLFSEKVDTCGINSDQFCVLFHGIKVILIRIVEYYNDIIGGSFKRFIRRHNINEA